MGEPDRLRGVHVRGGESDGSCVTDGVNCMSTTCVCAHVFAAAQGAYSISIVVVAWCKQNAGFH